MAALKGHVLHRKVFVDVFVMALLTATEKNTGPDNKVPRETAKKPLPPLAGKCFDLINPEYEVESQCRKGRWLMFFGVKKIHASVTGKPWSDALKDGV